MRIFISLPRVIQVLIVSIILTNTILAQAPHHQEPFGLKVEGIRSQMAAIKAKAELQAARDTRYCRGANIPAPKSEWKCERPGPGVERCQREYKCARIRADLSRLTETRRLLGRTRKLGNPSGDYQIKFYPESSLPLVAPLKAVRKKVIKPSEFKSKEEREVRPSEVSNFALPKRESLAPLPQESLEKKAPKSSTELIEQREEDESPLIASLNTEDEQDLESLMAEAPNEELNPTEQSSNSFKFEWMKLALSWVSSTNEFEESQSQFNFAWMPELIFSPNWSLVAQLGGHNYTVLTQEAEESFFVLDSFAHLQLSFWEDWQVWLGAGQQKWNSEQGESLTGLALGAARKINWGYLERVYIQRVSLSGDQDIGLSELRFGVTLSF